MKLMWPLLVLIPSLLLANENSAYDFLKKKSIQNKPKIEFNKYEDIISGSAAFVVGNIGYFTTESETLKLAYSGVQTVGIIAIGHGIHDYYYPHFELRLYKILKQEKITRGKLADDYVKLLGEMDRAKRLSLVWSSSLLTIQYTLNAVIGNDTSSDLKDIYLFLAGANAIVASYSYFHRSDYEDYYNFRNNPKVGAFVQPEAGSMKAGLSITKAW